MKHLKKFENHQIDTDIEYIITNQDNIDWDLFPDEDDFPLDYNFLKSLDKEEILEWKERLDDIIEQDQEKYQDDFIKHGRSE